jgi:hypothetical protein
MFGRWMAGAMLGVAVLLGAQVPAAPAPQRPGAVTATESGIWGGGFINVLAKDPLRGSKRFVIGGDTSGLHVSRDAGLSWTLADAGLDDLDETTVAAVAFGRPPDNREVFAAFGSGFGAGSGLLHSLDGGSTWTRVAEQGTDVPVFNGHTPGGGAA